MDTKCQLIEWRCRDSLEFKIKQPKETARLWGSMKNKQNFVYSELARGIRYYYRKGIIEKVRKKFYLIPALKFSRKKYATKNITNFDSFVLLQPATGKKLLKTINLTKPGIT